MSEEKRRFSRIYFDVGTRLEVGEELIEVRRLANLSVGGCLLELGEEVMPGTRCRLSLLLSRMAPAVEIEGEILRTGSDGTSMIFTSIDPENLFHLQNIVRYNAEDPDQVDEEISQRLGLK